MLGAFGFWLVLQLGPLVRLLVIPGVIGNFLDEGLRRVGRHIAAFGVERFETAARMRTNGERDGMQGGVPDRIPARTPAGRMRPIEYRDRLAGCDLGSGVSEPNDWPDALVLTLLTDQNIQYTKPLLSG